MFGYVRLSNVELGYVRTPRHGQAVETTRMVIYAACLQLSRCKLATNGHKNSRAQYLTVSRCWALLLPRSDLSTTCPCSGVQPLFCICYSSSPHFISYHIKLFIFPSHYYLFHGIYLLACSRLNGIVSWSCNSALTDYRKRLQ